MNLTRGLLLAIGISLAGLTSAWVVLLSPDKGWQPDSLTHVERQQQKEIVRLFIGHLAMGTPLPLTNPDEFRQPAIRLEGESTALFQVPEHFFGHAVISDRHVLLRSHNDAMTGQFSRHPDWIIRFDEERHSSGYWIVKLSSPNGPTKFIWEFELQRMGPRWQAKLISTTIGCL